MSFIKLFELSLSHPELEDFVFDTNCPFCNSEKSLYDSCTKSQSLEPGKYRTIYCGNYNCENWLVFHSMNILDGNRHRAKYYLDYIQFFKKEYFLVLHNNNFENYWYEVNLINVPRKNRSWIKKEELNIKTEYNDIIKILKKLNQRVEKLLPLI